MWKWNNFGDGQQLACGHSNKNDGWECVQWVFFSRSGIFHVLSEAVDLFNYCFKSLNFLKVRSVMFGWLAKQERERESECWAEVKWKSVNVSIVKNCRLSLLSDSRRSLNVFTLSFICKFILELLWLWLSMYQNESHDKEEKATNWTQSHFIAKPTKWNEQRHNDVWIE